jgi:exodeoxyribonuclease VII large subunit
LRLQTLILELQRAWRLNLTSKRERFLPLRRMLHAVSPLATLERGYAIVQIEGGDILRNAAHAKPGTLIEARLAKGRIRAKVEGAS